MTSCLVLPRGTGRAGAAFALSGAVGLTVALLALGPWPALARPHTVAYGVSGLAMTASDLALLLGVLAVRGDGLAGRGRLSTVATVIAAGGSVGVVVAEVLLRVDRGVGNALFGVVGPVQALGLILLGIAIARAGAVLGWRRWPTLVTGLYVPLVLAPALAASGGENLPALAGLHTLVLVTGLALLPAPDPSTARALPAVAGARTDG